MWMAGSGFDGGLPVMKNLVVGIKSAMDCAMRESFFVKAMPRDEFHYL